MEQILEAYKSKLPEVVFEWSDQLTDARGWLVINSLRGGAAGGGTRMRKGLTKEEVVSLAKVMEIKFSVCGPEIGGAKSGIDFDPRDPRRLEVLGRWYKAVIPILKTYYGTGGDLNVDEIKDVIPITEDLGLWHPQEGIVNGHLKPNDGQRLRALGQLRYGVKKVVENTTYTLDNTRLTVADLITGYGVAESIKHFYHIWHNQDLKGKRVIVQGWGNVASAAACYMANMGAKIVGIIDLSGGIIEPNGLSLEQVKKLYLDKDGNKLKADNLLTFEETNSKIWDLAADIFIPGAASKIITKDQVDRMIKGGLKTISCGANVPFIDDTVFFGETAKYTDNQISVIPDFVANCGMARVFAYLMKEDANLTDADIFDDVSETMRKALNDIKAANPGATQLSQSALKIALLKLSK